MPTTPRGPRLLKGAITTLDLSDSKASPKTIVFQYNPAKLSRTLTSQLIGGEPGQRSEMVRYKGAPDESFTVEVVLDATDDLEGGNSPKTSDGIYPQLSALEMLVYPRKKQIDKADDLLNKGQMEIGGPTYDVPLMLFVWGPNRVLPVSVASVTVTEEEFDVRLNPIRATLSLSLKALSYSNLDPSHRGYHLFMTYQEGKEKFAQAGMTENSYELTGFHLPEGKLELAKSDIAKTSG
jgi:hypothetical protein